jgi:hypothetical protein
MDVRCVDRARHCCMAGVVWVAQLMCLHSRIFTCSKLGTSVLRTIQLTIEQTNQYEFLLVADVRVSCLYLKIVVNEFPTDVASVMCTKVPRSGKSRYATAHIYIY